MTTLTHILTGCLAYLIATVPLATVALMIGCNGRNLHCLLTAEIIPDDRIQYVPIVILRVFIFFHLYTIVRWPLATPCCCFFESSLSSYIDNSKQFYIHLK